MMEKLKMLNQIKRMVLASAAASLLATTSVWATGDGAVQNVPAIETQVAVAQTPSGAGETVVSPVVMAGQSEGLSSADSGPGMVQKMPADVMADTVTTDPGMESPMLAGSGVMEVGKAPVSPTAPISSGAMGEGEAAGNLAAEQGAEETAGEMTGAAAELVPVQEAGESRYIDPSRPMVALTFDDGPLAAVGDRIMDCLAQYGGKATFFLVGSRVPSYASEVQRMVEEGHEVANHTMNHKYLQKLGAAEIQSQVNQCSDVIESVCGVRPTLMRLPGGNFNQTVLANTNMPMIQWNIDTLDWKTKNADNTVSVVLSQVKDGDIVLMHELYRQSADAAVRLIPELVNRGYQLVTVSEMAAAKGYALEAGKLYSAFR